MIDLPLKKPDNQMTIHVAGLNIRMNYRARRVYRTCEKFLTDGAPDLQVVATDEQMIAESMLVNRPRGFYELSCLYREIAEQLPALDRFVFHGALIAEGDRGYLFTAKSGTGKTTHINLWLEQYGDAVRVVNGDKPIIWKKDGRFYGCGTPWNGKEHIGNNENVPIAALCFLERAEENWIRPASKEEIINRVFHQIYRPKDNEMLNKMLSLLDELLSSVPCYCLGCNMEPEAAILSHDTLAAAR